MHNSDEKKAKPRHIRRRRALRALTVLLGIGAIGAIGATAGIIGAYYYVQPRLPAAETIRDIPLQVPLRIYSRDGYLIQEIGERKRIPVAYEEVPQHVIDAFVAAEDRRFFEHPGVDYRGIMRALGRVARTGNASGGGGSTLTQQLARDYFLTREQTIGRKLTEAFLAYKIEQEFSKQQIMALFLNKMFFGQRAYGVAAAAQVFFDKELSDINVAEAATLAGVLPAPSRYNPVSGPENAKNRRGYVLGRMRALGFIDAPTYDQSMDYPLVSKLHSAAIELSAPNVAEMVRAEMLRRYGEDIYTAGYQVTTTLDSRQQRAADYALRNGLLEFTRRRGYRGPIDTIEFDKEALTGPFAEWPEDIRARLSRYAPGGLSLAMVLAVNEDNTATVVLDGGKEVVLPWNGIQWANPFIDRVTFGPAPERADEVLANGDIIHVMPTANDYWALAQVPDAQGAVVSVDPYDGAVTALTGGFDFALSKFNRARQAYRQPGSAFKPFIYSAALEHGNTAATVVDDSPVVIRSSELEKDWRPINYSGRFYGPTRLREALVKSMNLVSVRLLLYETGTGNAVRHIEKFGFGGAALPHNGSLALGGGAATPLDMAQGYATLANGGYAVKPYVIDAIVAADQTELYRANPAVVCPECLVDEENITPEPTLTLEEIAEYAETYRPDANSAPELFAEVNAAPRVISEQNIYIVQDMMRDVVFRGTGASAYRALRRNDLSGKTGTSNDRRDAWFGGFNTKFAAMVWVGYDDDTPLGPREEGSRTALPIWIEFARQTLDGVPQQTMPMPDGITSIKIDRQTGCPAKSGQLDTTFEVFRVDHKPTCEQTDAIVDPFNNAIGADPPALPDGESPESSDEEDVVDDEALF